MTDQDGGDDSRIAKSPDGGVTITYTDSANPSAIAIDLMTGWIIAAAWASIEARHSGDTARAAELLAKIETLAHRAAVVLSKDQGRVETIGSQFGRFLDGTVLPAPSSYGGRRIGSRTKLTHKAWAKQADRAIELRRAGSSWEDIGSDLDGIDPRTAQDWHDDRLTELRNPPTSM